MIVTAVIAIAQKYRRAYRRLLPAHPIPRQAASAVRLRSAHCEPRALKATASVGDRQSAIVDRR